MMFISLRVRARIVTFFFVRKAKRVKLRLEKECSPTNQVEDGLSYIQ